MQDILGYCSNGYVISIIAATTRSKYSDIRYNRFTKRNDLTLIAVYVE